eukprot:SAG25_NODE_578_length_6770_cov_41.318801_4_plen_181_part_00
MPLPWERPSTSAVSSSSSARCGRGLEGGKHSEGFVTTLRDLSGRTGRFGGEASAVHSAEPSAAQHFVRATADLVSRTNAIALMTESVSKGPTAALGGEGGATRRRTTQLPGGGGAVDGDQHEARRRNARVEKTAEPRDYAGWRWWRQLGRHGRTAHGSDSSDQIRGGGAPQRGGGVSAVR